MGLSCISLKGIPCIILWVVSNMVRLKKYLENYMLEGDHEGFPLSAYYDFEIRKGNFTRCGDSPSYGDLFCYLVDNAEPKGTRGYKFGYRCGIRKVGRKYYIMEKDEKNRYVNTEVVNTRKEIVKLLEKELN